MPNPPRYSITPENFLAYAGVSIGPIESFRIGFARDKRDLVSRATKFDPCRGWRETGESLCIHPQFGPGVPLATDGQLVVFWCGGTEHYIVQRTNLLGPVGPWDDVPGTWNYVNNTGPSYAPAKIDPDTDPDLPFYYAAVNTHDFQDFLEAREALIAKETAKRASAPRKPNAFTEAMRLLDQI